MALKPLSGTVFWGSLRILQRVKFVQFLSFFKWKIKFLIEFDRDKKLIKKYLNFCVLLIDAAWSKFSIWNLWEFLYKKLLFIIERLILLSDLLGFLMSFNAIKHPGNQKLAHDILLIRLQTNLIYMIELLEHRQTMRHKTFSLKELITG
jgi:hypothetical protein